MFLAAITVSAVCFLFTFAVSLNNTESTNADTSTLDDLMVNAAMQGQNIFLFCQSGSWLERLEGHRGLVRGRDAITAMRAT